MSTLKNVWIDIETLYPKGKIMKVRKLERLCNSWKKVKESRKRHEYKPR